MTSSPSLSPRFESALVFAARLHAVQTRKGSGTPYVAHLLGVTSLVLEFGGSEDEAIAGLLHDALEDGPTNTGRSALDIAGEIEESFGDEVARLMWGCTDAAPDERGVKAPWAERKVAYLDRLALKDASTLLVSGADKLYNVRAILLDFLTSDVGETVFERFTAGRSGTLWYYERLAETFERRAQDEDVRERRGLVALIRELRRTVDALQHAAGSSRVKSRDFDPTRL
ncbi:HD domain-containing protein [Deinococcus yavapaiensis]|nr:HD domain-containing protein [Deinococcus yavapaiensis]